MIYLFLDTNVYTACACAELEGLDIGVLEKIKKKMDEKILMLIVPDVIRAEVRKKTNQTFRKLHDGLFPHREKETKGEKGQRQMQSKFDEAFKKKIEKLSREAEEKIKKEMLHDLGTEKSKAEEALANIFGHEQCRIIEISDEVLIRGMSRAVKLERPANVDTEKSDSKKHYVKDVDCIAFEMFCAELKKLEIDKTEDAVRICSSDSDYFDGKRLHRDIVESLRPFSSNIKGYDNILDLFEEELKERFTTKQKEEFEHIKSSGEAFFGALTVQGLLSQSLLNQQKIGQCAAIGTTMFTGTRGVTDTVPSYLSLSHSVSVCRRCGADLSKYEKADAVSITYLTPLNTIKYCPQCGYSIVE